MLVLGLAACGDDGSEGVGAGGGTVLPFEQVQASPFTFEADPRDPSGGVFRVTTSEPMICAIVWGETEEFGRFNNSLAMNGTGIVQHDVELPDVVPGRTYHFRVQGSTADGSQYRSESGTFTIEAEGTGPPPTPVPGENLAVGGTIVEVSSEFSDAFAARFAIDGDTSTEWATRGDGDDGYLVVDLGAPQAIEAVEFVTRSMADGSAITEEFTVTVDGGDPIGPFPASDLADPRAAEVDTTGQLVRLDVSTSTGGNVGAVEVRILGR